MALMSQHTPKKVSERYAEAHRRVVQRRETDVLFVIVDISTVDKAIAECKV